MALTLKQSEFTYSTSSGGQEYLFDVVVDEQGLVSVRNIRTASGIECSPTVPETVLDDIQTAKAIVEQLVSETTVTSGTVVFTGQTYQDVSIAAGVLNNTNYRVVYTTPDGTPIETINKTVTGFRANVGVAYGSPASPKSVDYVVLVSTQQASVTGATVTFTDADAGQKDITFASAFSTSAYRVILSPDGFFTARVINKATTGFTIELGYTLGVGETADVGYDVMG